jgi:hypothetical protein
VTLTCISLPSRRTATVDEGEMVETERMAAAKELGLVTGLPFTLLMASPTLMPALLAGPAAQCQKIRMMHSCVYRALLLLRFFDWLPGSNLIPRKEDVLKIIPIPGLTWGPAGTARRDLPSDVPAGLTALTSSVRTAWRSSAEHSALELS